MRDNDVVAGSESEGASDEAEASDASFGDTDEEDTGSGGPRMLVEPPSAPANALVWDQRDDTWSLATRSLYEQAWDNINKPSWVVYPSNVKKVLAATTPLVQHGVVLRCVRRALVPFTPRPRPAAARRCAAQLLRRELTRASVPRPQRPSGAVCARAGA